MSMRHSLLLYFLFGFMFCILKVNSLVDRFPRVTKCINQIQPNKDEIVSFRKKEIPKTEKGKCLLACYLEARGLMTRSGKFNQHGASRIVAKAYPGNVVKTGHVRHILSHCGAIVSNEQDRCELAARMAHCTTTLSEKFKL